MSIRPRLLVVGASPMRSQAFGVWREVGLDIVLVDGCSHERYEDLVQEFHALDPRDGADDLDAIARIARGCDGITTVADDSQLTVARIAELVGLPGIGTAVASIGRSKALQRAACREAGMRVPPWATVRSEEDLRAYFAKAERPSVIKPVDSAGGSGALRVETFDDAARHWPIAQSLSPSRTAVVEEFLDGREVCVDAIVSDGVVRFISVADCQHMPTLGFLCTAASYATDHPDTATAAREVPRVVAAIGLTDGIAHIEFKIDGDDWTVVEIGLRPGGAFVPELTVRVTGVQIYEMQARLALGEDPLGGRRWPIDAPYAESRYLVADGVVRAFVPPAAVLSDLPDVRVVNQQVGPGQRARVPLSEAGRAGYAYGWGPDADSLDEQLRRALARLAEAMGVITYGNHVPAISRRRTAAR